jgi:hypothetical protein
MARLFVRVPYVKHLGVSQVPMEKTGLVYTRLSELVRGWRVSRRYLDSRYPFGLP